MKSLKIAAVLGGIALFACSAPLPKNDFLWSSNIDKLQTVHPVDIAVAVPKDLTTRGSILPGIAPPALPLDQLRKITYRELINRRYSPLSLDYLDRAFLGKLTPAEASWTEFRDRCNAEAVLRTHIIRWEDTHLEARKMISIGAEIFLEDAKTGEVIWQAKADQDIYLDTDNDVDRVSAAELRERGMKRFMKKLLGQLPVREVPTNKE